MAIVADSGAVYALYDRRDSHHAAVARAVQTASETLIIPVVVLAEIDYLLRLRIGLHGSLRFLDDLAAGAFRVEPMELEDLVTCREVLARYPELDLGLCDAAVAVLAERMDARAVLTVDERDFRVIRRNDGRAFHLLPADALM